MTQFVGTGVALVTPFKNDLSVDVNALERLVNRVIEKGVEYLVVLGTTAESATLEHEEKQLVIDTVKRVNQNRLPLVLGVGGNNTAAVVRELQSGITEGFDAILSVSPYYNKPTQEGIYRHFGEIARHAEVPVILYNVPGRTASNMQAATVLRLAKEFDNIIGIKEASGDLMQAMHILKDKPKDFLVISGDDALTLPMVLAGGAGVISVIAQGVPDRFSFMVREGLRGNLDVANHWHYQLLNLMELIFEEGNPAGIKAVLAQQGICEPVVRLPLVEASEALHLKLADALSLLTPENSQPL
ncbi:4-hydroxy-tetrahydrodipicolinate synthase [Robertkochia aurantiaca]|uniref:4-hydroxy-tetrahydrodipicolinate synthase n=1 Tax=Robertkochia aurantiaca TaxID=2873700 RepID=UPI001CCC2ED3|nr:4-hydroxy-tetrahydrodipicolinate synthase [Robertkochia sp. 3YJGBD-33]